MPRIFQSQTMGDAALNVALVTDPGRADLCVHRVKTWGEARSPGLWFLTYDRQDADVWVYFCNVGFADIKICFVDNFTQAGWLADNPPLKARQALR